MINIVEIRDKDRETVAFIMNAISIIWQTEYVGTGNFEIVVPYSSEYNECLIVDNYVTRPDRTEIGFIEHRKISYSTDLGHTITISGRFGTVLLERRLLYKLNNNGNPLTLSYYADSYCGTVARDVVDSTLINSGSANRNVNWLALGSQLGFDAKLSNDKYSTEDNALTFVTEVLNEGKLGHKVDFDRDLKTATYDVYEGKTNTSLTFSQQLGTLTSFEYDCDYTDFKNGFLISGADTGTAKLYATTLRSNPLIENSGSALREYFYTNDSTRTYLDSNGSTVNMSASDYQDRLINECLSVYSNDLLKVSVTGTVDLSRYSYGTSGNDDFFVGDVATLIDSITGLSIKVRFISVTEVQDDNGYQVNASFESEE